MAAGLENRRDLFSPVELRSQARRERNPRTATRMLAIANALEGLTRAEAARLAGMERQALRDAVIRYNQEGVDGLRDRPKPGSRWFCLRSRLRRWAPSWLRSLRRSRPTRMWCWFSTRPVGTAHVGFACPTAS